MSQYQRMISYLYRYEEDVKKNNTGYARVELRGENCRVTVQLRDSLTESAKVAFFRQEPQGVQRIDAGQLKRNGNGFACRIETRLNNIMNTGYVFEDMDGILIYVRDSLYYATTWKDITVHIGQEQGEEKPEAITEEMGAGLRQQENQEVAKEGALQSEKGQTEERKELLQPENRVMEERKELSRPETRAMEERKELFQPENRVMEERKEQSQPETDALERMVQISGKVQKMGQMEGKTENTKKAQETSSDCQAASEPEKTEDTVAACQCEACRQCPQRERMVDFGRHILAMFPKMYPFEIKEIKECVRLDLKDIGCLPVSYWSLAGNPFLLHGYYCYRHILFILLANGQYCVGVPGIYNQEHHQQAKNCGFKDFRSLSEVADRQGAFGYWLFPVGEQ